MVRRIEICGGIASGKTTLAGLVRRLGALAAFENFGANPFWRAFCEDPVSNAFETELCFLLQHYHDIRTTRDAFVACDFSLVLDYAYSRINLDDRARQSFDSVYSEARRRIGPPSLLIHLRCDPRVQLERIRARGRAEENSLTLQYLRSLNVSLEQVVAVENEAPLLVLDSASRNFAADSHGIESTLVDIQAFFAA